MIAAWCSAPGLWRTVVGLVWSLCGVSLAGPLQFALVVLGCMPNSALLALHSGFRCLVLLPQLLIITLVLDVRVALIGWSYP